MEENRLVVSDTSPLLNLALINQLQLLESQFEEIMAPKQVWEEIQEGEKGLERIESYNMICWK